MNSQDITTVFHFLVEWYILGKGEKMRSVPILCGLLLFCSALAWTHELSLSEASIDISATLAESSAVPEVYTRALLGGRFMPTAHFSISSTAVFFLPDTLRFFHADQSESEPGFVQFEGIVFQYDNIASSTLSLSAFAGTHDNPASPTLLERTYKIHVPEPEFSSKPAGSIFAGSQHIRGTGISVAGVPGNGPSVAAGYLYWNTRTEREARMNADGRYGFSGQLVQFNAFGGVSLRIHDADLRIRGGGVALLGDPERNSLYTEIGIRESTPKTAILERNMYLLFEPRVRLAAMDFALTFFSVPLSTDSPEFSGIDEQWIPEGNYLGLNLLLGIGNLDAHGKRGGISLLGSINPLDPGEITPFSFSISPFYTVRISDFLLEVAAILRPLHFDTPQYAGEFRASFKAVY